MSDVLRTPRRMPEAVAILACLTWPCLAWPCLAWPCLAWTEVAAAESTTPCDAELPTEVRLTGTRIEYRGLITTQANSVVLDLFAAAQPKPTVLVIESAGGSADAALDLGSWLFAHGFNVEVDTFCFSSCANYVFAAGREKLLAPAASLLWHGGVTQAISEQELAGVLDRALAGMNGDERQRLLDDHGREELLRQLRLSKAALMHRETQFFAMIGVDQRITVLGHLYERELLRDESNFPGWDYSLQDLAALGVRNVHISGGQAWQPVFPIRGAAVYRLRLNSLPQFRPREALIYPLP